jgi:hypothetical protein
MITNVLPDQLRYVSPPNPELIDQISTSEVSPMFVQALIELMAQLSDEVVVDKGEFTVIVEVPRGGTVPARVVREMKPGIEYAVTNTGMRRDPEKPLIDEDFPIAEHYILPDGIMATGQTIQSIVEKIVWRCREYAVEPRFSMINPIVSAIGLQQEKTIFDWADENDVRIDVVTSHIEQEGGTVRFGDKEVLIVGQVQIGEDGQLLGAKIGDYGDMLEQAAADGLIPEPFRQ